MARPAISDERVIIEGAQCIRVELKSNWSDGTESLLFTPSEFLERLVALITPHKFYTTRYCGVLASRQRIPWIKNKWPQTKTHPLDTASQTHIQNRRTQVRYVRRTDETRRPSLRPTDNHNHSARTGTPRAGAARCASAATA